MMGRCYRSSWVSLGHPQQRATRFSARGHGLLVLRAALEPQLRAHAPDGGSWWQQATPRFQNFPVGPGRRDKNGATSSAGQPSCRGGGEGMALCSFP